VTGQIYPLHAGFTRIRLPLNILSGLQKVNSHWQNFGPTHSLLKNKLIHWLSSLAI